MAAGCREGGWGLGGNRAVLPILRTYSAWRVAAFEPLKLFEYNGSADPTLTTEMRRKLGNLEHRTGRKKGAGWMPGSDPARRPLARKHADNGFASRMQDGGMVVLETSQDNQKNDQELGHALARGTAGKDESRLWACIIADCRPALRVRRARGYIVQRHVGAIR